MTAISSIFPGIDAAPNIHPAFVHFPIALWSVAFILWLVAFSFRRDRPWWVGRWLLNIGLLGAAVAIGTGLWAEEKLGHESAGHDLVHLHRNLMLIASGIALATGAVAHLLRDSTKRSLQAVQLALMAAVATVTVVGADRGALISLELGGRAEDGGRAGDSEHEKPHSHGAEDLGAVDPPPPAPKPDAAAKPGAKEPAGHHHHPKDKADRRDPEPAPEPKKPKGEESDHHHH